MVEGIVHVSKVSIGWVAFRFRQAGKADLRHNRLALGVDGMRNVVFRDCLLSGGWIL